MSDNPELVHPWIARVSGTGTGLAVTVAPHALAVRRVPGGPPQLGDLVREHLEHWGEVYDWTYRSGEGAHRPDFDLSGWRATGSGEPLPAEHMAQWVDRTVELVLRFAPRTVLELGCGTGMLLHRLHPHLKGYVGTDVADHVVARLSGLGLPNVQVVRAAAHEINSSAVRRALAALGDRPDCVLLNSVTQCFPSVEYLAAVLHDAIDVVGPGGVVIVGDIRHAGLLDAHCRVLESGDGGEPAAAVAARVERRAAADTELLLDPATLAAVAASADRAVTMSLPAKTLTEDTELSRYRFDAVLHVDAEPVPAVAVHEWTALGPDPAASVRDLLGSAPLRVRGIPNGLLQPGAFPGARLRALLEGHDAAVLIDPDDPALLQIAAPAAAAATALDALAAAGRPHEPLGAFARGRVAEVVRGLLRRGGAPVPEELTVRLPSGPGHDAVTLAREEAQADRAGRRALGALLPGAARAGRGVPGGIAPGEDVVLDDDSVLQRLPAAIERFDEIALRALTGLMTSSGALRHGEPTGAEHVMNALEVAPRHAWIVRRWLAVLRQERLVTLDTEGRYLLSPGHAPAGDLAGGHLTPDDVRRLEESCADLGYPPEMAVFFEQALARLPELLRDEIMAQSLLFPDGDLLTSLSKDQRNVSNTYLNAAAGHVAGRAAGTRARPLRVVELGGGAGGSTAAALEGLAGAEIDYLFTDVSRFFTMAAEDRFGGRLRYGLLDINASLVEQGVDREGVDLVLAANVLHCARDAGRSLRWIREVLAPGGLLVLTEAIREHYLVLVTMQFLMSGRDGDPGLGTDDRRGGSGRVFFTGRELPAELAEARLRPVLELPRADSPLAAPAQHLFVAVAV
ncbi:SAM-dependent methyltransferase [Nonomuraea muscovyensis]|uniref:SAM-dependent methyltransferase n=1 Tax=Nonomuraea muscovyensis TaxID=1124761 RepID=A0A7X0CAW7_9ACTN|nr:methyltransferase [Nonomuraea muscovyensis]MBB6349964.1 SAM-dependent methyltransferase [Nonomuraea muscovyensis]